jgi:hypothetical protein
VARRERHHPPASRYGKDLSGYSLEDYTIIKHVMASLA